MFQETMTQGLGIVDSINTAAVNNTNTTSVGVDMSKVKRLMYIVRLDTPGNGQVNAQLQSAAASNFATPHNMTGTLSANFNTNNQLLTLEVRSDQVQYQNNGDRWVRLYVATNANIQVSAIGLGGESVQKPANQYNLNSNYIAGQVVCNT